MIQAYFSIMTMLELYTQSVYRTNNSNGSWSTGKVGSLNIRVATASNAAFEVCWNGLWYGPNPGNSPGIQLYSGQEEGSRTNTFRT